MCLQDFSLYLQDVLTSPAHSPTARRQMLKEWAQAPGARLCQPAGNEEHLLPLLVAAAAGGYKGTSSFCDTILGFKCIGFDF